MGRTALAYALKSLDDAEHLVLDFEEAGVTPSFGDELVGGLVVAIGLSEFQRRVELIGMTEDTEVLLKHVIGRRGRQAASSQLDVA